jgi:hypothetical protein
MRAAEDKADSIVKINPILAQPISENRAYERKLV